MDYSVNYFLGDGKEKKFVGNRDQVLSILELLGLIPDVSYNIFDSFSNKICREELQNPEEYRDYLRDLRRREEQIRQRMESPISTFLEFHAMGWKFYL